MNFAPRNVRDRVVQNPARYRLVEVMAGVFDFVPVPGTITEAGTEINKAYLQPIEDMLVDFMYRGYGDTAAMVSSGVDLNTIKTNGVRMGAELINAPTVGHWYMVEVIRHNDAWIYQRAISFTVEVGGQSPVYERTQNNGTWGKWVLRVTRGEAELTSDIPNTLQTPTIVNGQVTKIEHARNNSGSWETIRTDTFSYTSNVITEVRTLATGQTRTIYHHLATLQTEVY